MSKPKPTRIKVGDTIYTQGMLPFDEAPAPLAEPEVPAVVAQFYAKETEHEERENAVPASLVRPRRDLSKFFLPPDDDEEE